VRRGESFGERLAAEGEICWGGMHSWKRNVDLLEQVDRPQTLGFRRHGAHACLFTLGYNAPKIGSCQRPFAWNNPETLDRSAENDDACAAAVDDRFSRRAERRDGERVRIARQDRPPCLPNDPNGKLDVARHAGFWMRDEAGTPTRAFGHICWDGCMFPNATMMQPGTWTDVLGTMIAVRQAHGWD
jgi:hypothetical protein